MRPQAAFSGPSVRRLQCNRPPARGKDVFLARTAANRKWGRKKMLYRLAGATIGSKNRSRGSGCAAKFKCTRLPSA